MNIFLSKNVNGTTNSEDIQFNFFNLFEKEQKLGGDIKNSFCSISIFSIGIGFKILIL